MTATSDSSPIELTPDDALLALRPAVPAEPANPADAPSVGAFQHASLRPVLKLQNRLLLAVVADFVLDHHILLGKAVPGDQQRLVAELMTRNTKLRYLIIGLITAHFTTAEHAYYRQHRAELNRRILELAQRRVLDQLAALVALVAPE